MKKRFEHYVLVVALRQPGLALGVVQRLQGYDNEDYLVWWCEQPTVGAWMVPALLKNSIPFPRQILGLRRRKRNG